MSPTAPPGLVQLSGQFLFGFSVCAVAAHRDYDAGPVRFLEATAEKAREVLEAEDRDATYRSGLAFLGLAMSALSASGEHPYPPEVPTGLYLIWGALTDEIDAPGKGSPHQDVAAVRHMKKAAAEWLTVVMEPDERANYLDRWRFEECGYKRESPDDA